MNHLLLVEGKVNTSKKCKKIFFKQRKYDFTFFICNQYAFIICSIIIKNARLMQQDCVELHVGQIGRNKSKLLWKVGLLNFILYEFHVTSRLFLLLMDTLQLEPTRGVTQGNISFRCNFSCFSPFNDQSNFYYMMRIE